MEEPMTLEEAKETINTLVDALTEIRDKTTEPWAHRIAWDALAKVKEGKS